ncbi:2,3-butanediol dehydrogenase, R-alcohol forming, (R)- and (S)-acetoin-specific [hydrothermal vent metagenome]|uniref:2,3-butanediol dehydrogenase, R-alcohol forming, (R)- and (S)-acetoin-specific n=1 Tax=hydrothermal vent metagenome TaxID=652676 RepID=A0A3B0RJU1_9ZZZZ
MQALRYYQQKDFRLETISEPRPGPDEAKVKVKWCGICGSDVQEYLSGPKMVPTRPHPQTGLSAPVTGGHEFSGSIVETGKNLTGFAVGDRVVVRPTLPCYHCHYCRQGRYIQCAVLATLGSSANGAFAEYVTARSDCLHKLPDNVSFEDATYAEPLACAIRAVQRSGMEPGATVVVLGAGPIGLLTMQTALACGASRVFVFETVESRRALAEELGATAGFDPREGNPGKIIASLTNGRRAEIVFECAGTGSALLLADSLSGRGSVILQMGVPSEPVEFPFYNLFMREKTIVASQGYVNNQFETALEFIANGKVRCDPVMTSAKIPLAEIVEEGFEVLTGPQASRHCKILVSPEQ